MSVLDPIVDLLGYKLSKKKSERRYFRGMFIVDAVLTVLIVVIVIFLAFKN